MSAGRVRYEVYWTKDIAKKHQTWCSGTLSWNPDNSQVFLFDEDNIQREGNGFVKGGPIIGKKYTVGQHLVEILECLAATSSPVADTQTAAASSPKPQRPAPSIPPPAKRRLLHPTQGATRATSSDAASANPPNTPTPIAAPVPAVSSLNQQKPMATGSITDKFRPSVQQPFKRPSRLLPKPQDEPTPPAPPPSRAPVYEPEPRSLRPPPSTNTTFGEPTVELEDDTDEMSPPSQNRIVPPTSSHELPSAASNNSAFMLPWNVFDSPLPLQQPAANAMPAAARQPISTAPASDLAASSFVPGTSNISTPPPASTSTEELSALHALPAATGSTRLRTWQSIASNSRDASAIVRAPGAKPPPPLPPRAPGVLPDLNLSLAAAASMSRRREPSVHQDTQLAPPPASSAPPSTPTNGHSLLSPTHNGQAAIGPHSARRDAPSKSPASPLKQPSNSVSPARTKKSTNSVNAPFKPPSVVNPHDAVLGWQTQLLCFPSRATLARLPKMPRRATSISTSFNNLNDYKKQFSEALFEEINHSMLPLATRFRAAQTKHSQSSAGSQATVSDAARRKISLECKQAYFDCTLIHHALDTAKKGKFHARHSSAGSDAPSPAPTAPTLPPMYLKLPYSQSTNQEPSSSFQKDDLWIISSTPTFEPSLPTEFLFLARSTMHGRSSSVMEVKPLVEGSFGSNMKTKLPKLDGEVPVHVIHGPSVSSEIGMLDCLYELSNEAMPLIPSILNRSPSQNATASALAPLPNTVVDNALREFLADHRLNDDQAAVFKRAAAWLKSERDGSAPSEPIALVHGVFGSGKSHMLVLLIIFLCELLDRVEPTLNASKTGQTGPVRILVSAATNTAVDRILLGLLEEGFDDFVRVGSLKRINSQILPHSIHRDKSSGSSSSGKGGQDFEAHSARSTSDEFSDHAALNDLNDLLRSRGLTAVQRALIEEKIMEIKTGQIERKMGLVETSRVVGATCIATTFPILLSSRFDLVILDECSQMPEPLSLLPVSRFGTRALLLVGDPLQLPPQLKSKPKSDDMEQEGLGSALFSRLSKVGYQPILLRAQYRLHPTLSNLANQLFYNNHLLNGISATDRPPLTPALPPLLFVDVEDANESVVGGGSVNNSKEASIISLILQNLLTAGIDGQRIGVICLYKSQADLITSLLTRASSLPHLDHLKEELALIQISTVDAFQGAEKDVIVLSSVRTDSLGFIDSPFRMNVSLTRGRHHLIVVGSAPLLATSVKWHAVLTAAKAAGSRSYISSHAILSGEYFPPLPST